MSEAQGRAEFPPTRWSRILAPGGDRDLDALFRDYEGPIRAFLAARLRLRAHDAADAAQDAVAWMLQKDLFGKADPTRGRFRAFLKTALANFAIERLRHDAAQKRGSGRETVALETTDEPVDETARSADDVLDERWRAELLQRARTRLQRELEDSGRELHWAVFRDWFLAEDDDLDHQTLALRHGITRTDVSNWLDHGKRRFRALLRECVAETVRDEQELQDELRWLFAGTREARS